MKVQYYYLLLRITDVSGNVIDRIRKFKNMSACYAAYVRAFKRNKKFFEYFKNRDEYYSRFPNSELGFEKKGWYDYFGNFVVDNIEGTCEFSFTISKDGFNPTTYHYKINYDSYEI